MNSRMKHRLFVVAVIAVLVVVLGAWLVHEIQVDECFDRGGVWNDRDSQCEGIEGANGRTPAR